MTKVQNIKHKRSSGCVGDMVRVVKVRVVHVVRKLVSGPVHLRQED